MEFVSNPMHPSRPRTHDPARTIRDPKRIEIILGAIRKTWEQDPDLRLGQLLLNAIQPEERCPAVYYVEDDVMLERLTQYDLLVRK
ncbi:MAG: hypothetical protein NTV11_20330 [Rhodocyclales bacterium]|nr:hypothetical protein [Rhodocyclales bacterium]